MDGQLSDSQHRRNQDRAARAALTPFVERLIGTMRREFLDHVLFWNGHDLERKLAEFQSDYNAARCHASLEGRTPLTFANRDTVARADLTGCGGSRTAGTLFNSPSCAKTRPKPDPRKR